MSEWASYLSRNILIRIDVNKQEFFVKFDLLKKVLFGLSFHIYLKKMMLTQIFYVD